MGIFEEVHTFLDLEIYLEDIPVPAHTSLKRSTLFKIIKSAGMNIDEFLELL